MLLKYFYDEKLAQASYLVGCAKTGEALVIDPMRNITPYLRQRKRRGCASPTSPRPTSTPTLSAAAANWPPPPAPPST